MIEHDSLSSDNMRVDCAYGLEHHDPLPGALADVEQLFEPRY
jgi:hypothetical protein